MFLFMYVRIIIMSKCEVDFLEIIVFAIWLRFFMRLLNDIFNSQYTRGKQLINKTNRGDLFTVVTSQRTEQESLVVASAEEVRGAQNIGTGDPPSLARVAECEGSPHRHRIHGGQEHHRMNTIGAVVTHQIICCPTW